MDDLNPSSQDNKIFETEPDAGPDVAGFSAQAQRDKFLGGSSEKQGPNESSSFIDRTLGFLKRNPARTMTPMIAGGVVGIGSFVLGQPIIGELSIGLGSVGTIFYEAHRQVGMLKQAGKDAARIRQQEGISLDELAQITPEDHQAQINGENTRPRKSVGQYDNEQARKTERDRPRMSVGEYDRRQRRKLIVNT